MEIMTDIELYRNPDASVKIFQISSVAFDLDGKIGDPHELIQQEDCWFDAVIPNYRGFVKESAGRWWDQPEQAPARASLLAAAEARGEQIESALDRFARFVGARLGKKGGHWANPPGFDLDVIRANYSEYGERAPWRRQQERHMRTLMEMVKRLAPVKMPDVSEAGLIRHNGLHDAARQATLVQAAYRQLGLRAGDFARSGAANV